MIDPTFAENLLWKWDEERRRKHKAELRKILVGAAEERAETPEK